MNNIEQEQRQALDTLNPTNIEQQLKDIEGAVLGGHIAAVDAALAVKKFTALLDNLKKAINESTITEMRSWTTGYDSSHGKIELRNSATRYDFKHIAEWVSKRDELKEIEEKSKLVAKTGAIMYDDEGVLIEAAKVSGGGESIFITLKK